jgi:hypothetical protein
LRTLRIAPAALLAFLIVCVYWKLTLLRGQYTWLDPLPLAGKVLPWMHFEAAAFHNHYFPLWNEFTGRSVLTGEDAGAAYPLNWLLFLSPMKRGWLLTRSLTIYFILIHWLAGWGAYLLVRRLGHSREAGVFAGLIFGASGYLGTEIQPAQWNAATWAPWILWQAAGLEKSAAPWRESALAGCFLGLACLSGALPLAGVLAMMTAVLWLLWAWPLWRQRWWALAVCALLALLVGGLTLMPALADAWRLPLPLYSAAAEKSFDLDGIFGLVIPNVRNDLTPFAGLVVVALASIALRAQWQVREVRVLAGIAAVGFAFALGRMNVFHGMLYGVLPWLAREPVRAIALTHVAFAALAGIGLDAARQAVPRYTVKALLLLAAFCCSLIVGLLMFVSPDPRRFVGVGELAMIAFLLAGAFAVWQRGAVTQKVGIALVFAVALTEIGNQTTYSWVPREKGWPYLEKLRQNEDILKLLKEQGRPLRVAVHERDVPVDFGTWHGIETVPLDSAALHAADYAIAEKPHDPAQHSVFAGASGLQIYTISNALPRVWTVHQIGKGPIAEPAMRDQASLNRTAPQLATCAGHEDGVELLHDTGSIVYSARLNCRGLLVLNQPWNLDWIANVDGRRAQLWQADGLFPAVAVPAGDHRITLIYRPVAVYTGAGMSLLGFVLFAWMIRVNYRAAASV